MSIDLLISLSSGHLLPVPVGAVRSGQSFLAEGPLGKVIGGGGRRPGIRVKNLDSHDGLEDVPHRGAEGGGVHNPISNREGSLRLF